MVSGVKEAVTVLEGAIFELEISAEAGAPEAATETATEPSTRVFIVHRQDDARKIELAALLQSHTGEEPVILHQQPKGEGADRGA